jgi:hypothetical protein
MSRRVARSGSGLSGNLEMRMDPVVIGYLGRGHPLDRHIRDFLTYPFSTIAPGRRSAPTCSSSPHATTAKSAS